MTTYLDIWSLGPQDTDIATRRCQQLGIGGSVVPYIWRYQLLHQAGDGDTVICGPLALPFWRKLASSVRLVSIASLDDIDPLVNRFDTWEEWALVTAGCSRTETGSLLAKAPSHRHKHYQRYQTAMGIAFVMESKGFVVGLPEFEQLQAKVEAPVEHPYKWALVSEENAGEIISKMLSWDRSQMMGIDVETDIVLDHPNEMLDIMVGVGISLGEDCYYGNTETWFEFLRGWLIDVRWCGANSKYDASVLRRYGINVPNPSGDSMLAEYLHGVPEAGLKARVWERYGIRMITYEDVVGKGTKRRKISECDPRLVGEYCCGDAYFGHRVEADSVAELTEQRKALYRSDLSLIPIIMGMQFDGMPFDREAAAKELADLELQGGLLRVAIDKLVQETGFATPIKTWVCKGCRNGSRKRPSCSECKGVGKFSEREPFNPGSDKQIREWLHDHLKLPVQGITPGGEAQVNALSLLRLRPYNSAVELLLIYATYEKHIGFLRSWLEWSEQDEKLHTVFTMARTRSSRHSSSDPNLQQTKGDWREYFKPPEGRQLIVADYGQIEVRGPAFMSKDPGLVTAMTAPQGTRESDLHAQNVEAIFGVSYADQQLPSFNKSMRTRAKNYLFGAFYGSMGKEIQEVIEKAMLAEGMIEDVPTLREINKGIMTIRDKYPVYFHEWIPAALHHCREAEGWASTLYGHVRYLPNLFSEDKYLREAAERAAISHIIQGTAGDVIRFAKQGVARWILDNMQDVARTLHLTVHDELVISSRTAEDDKTIVREIMELDQPFMPIPLVVDVTVADNWKEGHK